METIAFGTCQRCEKYGQVYATGGCKNCLKQDDHCPQCKVGFLERVSHRFSSDRGPNLPYCDWLLCLDCGFETEPE